MSRLVIIPTASDTLASREGTHPWGLGGPEHLEQGPRCPKWAQMSREPQGKHVPGRNSSGRCQVSGSWWAAKRLGMTMEPAGTGTPPTLEQDKVLLGWTGTDWSLQSPYCHLLGPSGFTEPYWSSPGLHCSLLCSTGAYKTVLGFADIY